MHTTDAPLTRIEWVTHPPLTDIAASLFREYQSAIAVDLSWQGFDDELLHLPGEYAAPHGLLILAFVGDDAAGCCAFRPLHDCDYPNACEMKRLFVRKAYRGFGLGRLLVDHTVLHAKQAGYSTMLLDTLTDMETARALYAQAGFVEVPP